ncbi:MFS transporter [Lentilitoribacter sp. Alg239-R112]|uniref:MFS transporter n=1 Tax=Lentilitoribacter sp. Alg239-R112 TaxID=2305987 RepID=UPI0013A6D6E6|nr:MFS transporter [Lentilitoribacter sp. Alg239-R112]
MVEMHMIRYFIFVNFLSSVSIGVFLIALPWLIIKTQGSDSLIAVNAAAMMFLFLLRKRSGILVDSISRAGLFATAMLLMALFLAILAFQPDNVVLLLGVFFFGHIYLFFYYVIRSAITRDIVPDGQFGRYNGILEIEGQVSTFVAGGLTAYIFAQNVASLSLVFGCAAAGMIISASIVLMKLHINVPSAQKEIEPDGLAYKQYPLSLLLLSYCGSVPFICVMLLNIIKPIVIVDFLQYSGEVLALTSVFYTVGATSAGTLGSRSWIETASERVVFLTLVIFLLSCALLVINSSAVMLYFSSIIWGVSNGLSRITWQTAAMNKVGTQDIGKFLSSISAGVGVGRICLLLIYWVLMSLWGGYELSFIYLAAICATGLIVFVAGCGINVIADRDAKHS